jgi:hypothetical protein
MTTDWPLFLSSSLSPLWAAAVGCPYPNPIHLTDDLPLLEVQQSPQPLSPPSPYSMCKQSRKYFPSSIYRDPFHSAFAPLPFRHPKIPDTPDPFQDSSDHTHSVTLQYLPVQPINLPYCSDHPARTLPRPLHPSFPAAGAQFAGVMPSPLLISFVLAKSEFCQINPSQIRLIPLAPCTNDPAAHQA